MSQPIVEQKRNVSKEFLYNLVREKKEAASKQDNKP